MILPILDEGGIATIRPRVEPSAPLPGTAAGEPSDEEAQLRQLAREIATYSPKLAEFLRNGTLAQ